MTDRLNVVCPHCDTTNRVAARSGIRGIPTLSAFRNGREMARQSGALDLASLLRWIEACAGTAGTGAR